jgi:hypothetical protein
MRLTIIHSLHHICVRTKVKLLSCLLLSVIWISDDVCLAQSNIDTTGTTTLDSMPVKVKKTSIFSGRPGKALMYSLIIPGTGQIYNKSYLRVPFVWGAVGGMGYLVHKNTQEYKCLRDAYKASIDGEPYTFPDHCSQYDMITNPSQLKTLRDEKNEDRQLSIVGFTLVWLANGIDAFVNAHLKEFDVNEDLSIDFGTRYGDDPYSPMRVGLFVSF